MKRYLSPSSKKGHGIVGLVLELARAETIKNLRLPMFVISTLVFPAMLFILFGLPSASIDLPSGTKVGNLLIASFSAYGLLGVSIFSFGVAIAVERGQGWLKLLRATPMPAWTYFLAKIIVVIVFNILVVLVMFAVGYFLADVRMPIWQWLRLGSVLILGALPFSTLGFALGYWASPNSASPVANLIYLPLSFASGLFIPLSQLPQIVQDFAPYLPTYHYGQLVWQVAGKADDVALLLGPASGDTWTHISYLATTFVVFAILAIIGFKRDENKNYS